MKKSNTANQKMKKNNHSSKKNKNMEAIATPKTTKKSTNSTVSAVTDYVVEILSSVLSDDDLESARSALEEKHSELQKIVSKSMPSQKSTLKKVKDPNAPKRGKSSYIFFCVDKREEIKTANPDMSATEIIKELGRVWRDDLSDKDRKKYADKSVEDKERYDKEMESYTPVDLGYVTEKKKKCKRSGPKRGLTAYIFFCKEHRQILKDEDPDMSTKDITSELGKRWKALSDKDKKPFVKLAEKDKERYQDEKKTWVETDSPVEEKTPAKKSKSEKKTKPVKEKSSKKTKSEKKSKSEKSTKPRKKSGYILFCQEQRESLKADNSDMTSQQITKELGRAWKELSDEEQAEYNEKASDESVETEE